MGIETGTKPVIDFVTNPARPFDDDNSTVLASYKYLGAGRIVTEDYEDVAVKLDYNADDSLGGFDRFGRVADQVWQDDSGTPTTQPRSTASLTSNPPPDLPRVMASLR